MRQILVLLLVCAAPVVTLGQIDVKAWTDRSSYQYGDTVAITVTAHNPTADTVILQFPSACQANYILDDFNFYHNILCALVLTSRTIAPFTTVSWPNLKYPHHHSSWPPLQPGVHTVIGEVLGYARSDTLLIVVTPLTSVDDNDSHVHSILLGPNYPNPFNGTTSIPLTLSSGGRIKLAIYNALGVKVRIIVDEYRAAGTHVVQADLRDLPSGAYWCRLETAGKYQTTRLLLSR